jgi:glycosyltransferase involved in cell wall biosynthesis
MNWLTAIPVYNEERHLDGVLREVRRYSPDILVVNDGSTDRTGQILSRYMNGRAETDFGRSTLRVLTHSSNRG